MHPSVYFLYTTKKQSTYIEVNSGKSNEYENKNCSDFVPKKKRKNAVALFDVVLLAKTKTES